ncbi:MAG: hypothetical protein ACK46L_14605 [Synechococcaceae cyanobacterium]|jgi:hypothetical protein
MNWNSFLESIGQDPVVALTSAELDVVMCLREEHGQTKQQLYDMYLEMHAQLEEEAFTQRLRTIYRKFGIHGRGYKLPQLHRLLTARYQQDQQRDQRFSRIGLARIHEQFPAEVFATALDGCIASQRAQDSQVDILQTFAPNLDQFRPHLIRALDSGVRIRILLAWPYSLAAALRQDVLKRYASMTDEEIDIQGEVIANLEILESTLRSCKGADVGLQIRLYDTLPSLAIYRAGSTLLAAPFLHGSLAIHTFQLELDLQAADPVLTGTLLQDFELMWKVARPFTPTPGQNWRSELRILFAT